MTIPAPYFSRTKKDLAESKKEAQRYAPLFNGDIKPIKWPTDKEFCDIRILPPTWNALNPYGPALRLGKDNITQEMFPSSPFFKVYQYYEIGPTKAQFLSSGDMLYEYSGAGSEAAHDLYKKLGGDFIYNYKQSLTDKEEIKLYNAGSKFYAFCIDRRDNSLKLIGISGKLYQSFVLSSVDEDTQEPLPYDAWDNTGYDVRVTLEPGNFNGKSFTKMVGMSIAPATKRKACLPSSEEIAALQQRLYANPLPKLMNFLTSSDMERKLGLSAIGGGKPSDDAADDEDVSSMTSWGSKTKTETKAKTKKASPIEEVSTDDEDNELEDFKVASVSSRKVKPVAKDEDEEETEEEEVAPKSSKGKPPARPAPDADEDEDEAPPVKPPKSSKTAKEMAKSAAKNLPDAFEDEDEAPAVEEEEEEEEEDVPVKAPAKKPAAPTKTGTKQAKMTTAFDDDDDESPAPAPAKAAKPEPAKAKGAKAQTKLESAFDDDDE